jgi:hypothetical protein
LREVYTFIRSHGAFGELLLREENPTQPDSDNPKVRRDFRSTSISIVQGILGMLAPTINQMVTSDSDYGLVTAAETANNVQSLIDIIKKHVKGDEDQLDFRQRQYLDELRALKQAPTASSIDHFQELVLFFNILDHLDASLSPKDKVNSYIDSISPSRYQNILVHKYDNVNSQYNAIVNEDVKIDHRKRNPSPSRLSLLPLLLPLLLLLLLQRRLILVNWLILL